MIRTADEGFIIRSSPVGAVLMVAWIVFLCLLMVAGALNEHDPRGLFLVLIWMPWLVPVVWFARFRLSVDGDVLTYRRPLRTRSWRRDQIAEFGIVQSAWQPRLGCVYMHARRRERRLPRRSRIAAAAWENAGPACGPQGLAVR